MVYVTICGTCKHCQGLTADKTKEKCEAFPEGRDNDIFPEVGIECANGLFYEPIEGFEDIFKKWNKIT